MYICYYYRAADKKKFEDILNHNQNEMLAMSQKLQLAETKIRFSEQAGRDENSVSSLVSQVEFDELQREFNALKEKSATMEEEFSARNALLQHATNELANALQAKQELERAKVRLDAKVR